MSCTYCGDAGHQRRTCPRLSVCVACGERCGRRECRKVAAPEPGSKPWDGPGEDLLGLHFGELVVEGPAPTREGDVRVWVRCRCGRSGVRRAVDLHRGRETACRVCTEAQGEASPDPGARTLLVEGEARTLIQISADTGVPVRTLQWRLREGWSLERVLAPAPVRLVRGEAGAATRLARRRV